MGAVFTAFWQPFSVGSLSTYRPWLFLLSLAAGQRLRPCTSQSASRRMWLCYADARRTLRNPAGRLATRPASPALHPRTWQPDPLTYPAIPASHSSKPPTQATASLCRFVSRCRIADAHQIGPGGTWLFRYGTARLLRGTPRRSARSPHTRYPRRTPSRPPRSKTRPTRPARLSPLRRRSC